MFLTNVDVHKNIKAIYGVMNGKKLGLTNTVFIYRFMFNIKK
jgi:hypothetical protein